MPRVQFRVNGSPVRDTLADASTEFPDAEFRILASQPLDDHLFEIVEVTTSDGDKLVRHFEDAPEVRSFEVIHSHAQTILIRFTIPISETYNALLESGNLPLYPIPLHDGWFSGEIRASHQQLSAYVAELSAAGVPYQILSVTQTHDSVELLTERQWEFVTAAVEQGFYDTSRECTLSELAETLDVNVSAVSRLRHRAESRIISSFVAEAGPKNRS
ncbi:helix-turn-helix domain-containing protein [Haloferax mediterranei ATCC 33500]|uniref:DNA-binding protein n=1 Tax=Haloferax mediterranei (strain ATCC 33500 / DSM 1411 / JCM 8866 / NBRC 14739 / NCIMB 2177 / R-4) TaxID=523841 RepID=M0IUP0_HALMT|nr:DNA-binding protein [Haloferax mediterranei ATCC 33500]ELZ99209.1 hypothetical protein C439_15159 [Haloferax mediterranei ATCC 33500]QCQ76213.1 helix-turn-helix domain-containing protein [Haloferax mediterranei ATCC 33500]